MRLKRLAAGVLALSCIVLHTAHARGEAWPVLGPPSPWAVSLEPYAGLLVQFPSGEDRAHAFGGGQLRGRFHYFQAGAFIDTTDSGEAEDLRETTQEHFTTVGGFVGAWLPFRRWIDVDASLGMGARSYRNPIALYGPGGLRENMPAITFRLGVSDRSSEAMFGVRAGAAIVASVDLDPRDVTFYRTYLLPDGTPAQSTGTTPIGGVSFGVLVTVGFEVCACKHAEQ